MTFRRWIARLALGLSLAALPACKPQQPQGAAPTPQPGATATATATRDADPALWVVRDPDTTIYLFGTVHMLRPGLSWFDEAVRKAFDASDMLVLELVMPPPAEMQQIVAEVGMRHGEGSLPDEIGPAETGRLRAALTRYGLAPDALDQTRPWLAATMLGAAPLRQLGYDDKDGAEAVLADAARAKHKPVIGLETARQQFGYFDSLPRPAQRALLSRTIDELPTTGATIDRMVAAWSAGDADTIARLMNDDIAGSPELAEALLVRRNRNWARWIAARMHAPGTVFVAVGAGHLAGPQSVQAELARQGIKAERIAY